MSLIEPKRALSSIDSKEADYSSTFGWSLYAVENRSRECRNKSKLEDMKCKECR